MGCRFNAVKSLSATMKSLNVVHKYKTEISEMNRSLLSINHCPLPVDNVVLVFQIKVARQR